MSCVFYSSGIYSFGCLELTDGKVVCVCGSLWRTYIRQCTTKLLFNSDRLQTSCSSFTVVIGACPPSCSCQHERSQEVQVYDIDRSEDAKTMSVFERGEGKDYDYYHCYDYHHHQLKFEFINISIYVICNHFLLLQIDHQL